MVLGGQCHALAALPPGKTSGTRCIGGCLGPRAGLENLVPPGFVSRAVQHVASRYTDYTIPSHIRYVWEDNIKIGLKDMKWEVGGKNNLGRSGCGFL
jgi:hypothetical protein